MEDRKRWTWHELEVALYLYLMIGKDKIPYSTPREPEVEFWHSFYGGEARRSYASWIMAMSGFLALDRGEERKGLNGSSQLMRDVNRYWAGNHELLARKIEHRGYAAVARLIKKDID